MKKAFIVFLQFMGGILFPAVLYTAASAAALYDQIFVNYSIPFVLGIPLWAVLKIRKRSRPFFYGTLTGLLLVTALIIYGFVVIARVQREGY